jgi:hypothetical protein
MSILFFNRIDVWAAIKHKQESNKYIVFDVMLKCNRKGSSSLDSICYHYQVSSVRELFEGKKIRSKAAPFFAFRRHLALWRPKAGIGENVLGMMRKIGTPFTCRGNLIEATSPTQNPKTIIPIIKPARVHGPHHVYRILSNTI